MVQETSFFQRLSHHLMWVLVAVLITLAVVFSLARLLLPSIDGYRQHVEASASELIGLPVSIQAMDARLLGFDPTIILKGVQLKAPQHLESLARFDEAHLTLDLIETLRTQRPVIAELVVVGMDLTVERRVDGSLAIQGLPLKDGTAPAGEGADLSAWLMAQGHLSLLESRVTWRDLTRKGRHWTFDSVNIELQNSANRHQLNAEIVLPRGMGSSLGLYADLKGDITKPRGWQGRFYLEAGGLHPGPWLDGVDLAGMNYQKGTVDINLWAEWAEAELHKVRGELALSDLRLQRGRQISLELDRLAANLAWDRREQGWELKLGELYLEKQGSGWEPAQIALSQQQGHHRLRADYLRLDELSELLQVLPLLDKEQLAMLQGLAPGGVVRGLRAEQLPEKGWHVQADLERAGINAWKKLPGVRGLSGRVVWRDWSAHLELDGHDTRLDMPRLFRAPLALQHLQGGVWLQREQDNSWQVSVPSARVANSDLALDLSMEMRLPGEGKPFVELYGRYRDVRAASTPKYLPAHILPPATLAWLDQAFVSGKVPEGGVVLHGDLKDFPFTQGQGRFEVGFEARQMELDFLEGWPHFSGLDARVVFLGQGLAISASRGKLFNAELKRTQVRIPVLKRAVLEVDGQARVLDQDVLRLLTETPLNEAIGRHLSRMRHQGSTELQLRIEAPLSSKIKDRHLQVEGSLSMGASRLQVHEGLLFTGIKGTLSFDEQSLDSEHLEAELFGHPVLGDIVTAEEGDGRRTVIRARGEMAGKDLAGLIHHPLFEEVHGVSGWEARLLIGHHGQGGTSLQIDSALQGMAVDLPTPLGKAAAEPRHLALSHFFSGAQQGLTHFRYGQQADVLLQLDERQGRLRLQRGNIHFGQEQARLPEDKQLRISGKLQAVDLGAWGRLLRSEGGAPQEFVRVPVLVDMEKLSLSIGQAHEQASPAAPTGAPSLDGLPPLTVRIKQFGINNIALHSLAFNTRHVGESFLLENLKASGPALKVSGQGRSFSTAGHLQTQLKLNLESENLGWMFNRLGFKSVIHEGETRVDASFNWPGNLLAFELGQLGGQMHLSIKDGRIEDLDPGAGGRLLGLLSVQALPRRLILDFGDMFEDGLSFDSITGDVRFKKGEAFTDNTTLEATSAKVLVTGRTGLVAEDFDQRITVFPNVSDTVPVAGALAWGPQVGAALLLVKKLLFSGLDKAAKFEYTVSGSWEQPQIEQVIKESPVAEESPLFE